MKIAPDTNVLVRFLVEDDPVQGQAAKAALAGAELIVVTLPALCELTWVLSRTYRLTRAEIGAAIRNLIDSAKVVVDRPAAEAGLALLAAGSDFADGVIAHDGDRLGADAFVSFDRRAVRLVEARGGAARLLG